MCNYKTLLLTVEVYFAGMGKRKRRFVQNYLALHFLGKEPEPQSLDLYPDFPSVCFLVALVQSRENLLSSNLSFPNNQGKGKYVSS